MGAIHTALQALQAPSKYPAPFSCWSAVGLLLHFSAALSTWAISFTELHKKNSASAKTGLFWSQEVGTFLPMQRPDKWAFLAQITLSGETL
jgi:hypothetical protein